MRLLFLTLSPLSSNAGHLARLSAELNYLSESNKICIVCLGKNSDDISKNAYKGVSFFHSQVKFDGWKVENQAEVLENIDKIVEEFRPGLVVLQMEVWDLMRELGRKLKGRVGFATVVHAMPFLIAPVNPSGDFNQDVIKYVNSGIEDYRRKYILSHYKEAREVFNNVHIVANNKTVAAYFNIYFKDLSILTLPDSSVIERKQNLKINGKLKYDFAYMARMEKGKGVEYLANILKKISLILSRRVKIAILGRADDNTSKLYLEKLVEESDASRYFEVDYVGWADNLTKQSILPYCGVFLYPSHLDNYPTVVNEALSFGLPVITWDVPFSKLNYSNTDSVKRISFLNFQKFADAAVKSFNNREELSIKALDFINSFDSLSEIAKQDTRLFEQLIMKNG